MAIDSRVEAIDLDVDVSSSGDQVGGVFGTVVTQSFTTPLLESRIAATVRAGAGEAGGLDRAPPRIGELSLTSSPSLTSARRWRGARSGSGALWAHWAPTPAPSTLRLSVVVLDAALPAGACPLSPKKSAEFGEPLI